MVARPRIGPDKRCIHCGTLVYTVFDRTLRTMEAETYRPHECDQARQDDKPVLVRCPDCRLSVYEWRGGRWDDDAATGRHACHQARPEPRRAEPFSAPRAEVAAPAPAAPLPDHILKGPALRWQLEKIRELRAAVGITDDRDLPPRMTAGDAQGYIEAMGQG